MTRFHWRVLLVLMAAETISGFEASMILAALSAWQRKLGDPILVGWIVTSYLLVSAAASAVLGRLGDIFGRKTVLLWVIALAGLGSMISAVSHNVWLVIFGRGIQGVAGAVIPLCYGVVNEHLPREKIPFGVGMVVATAATASAFGLLLGGILTDNFGPESVFYGSAALALMVFPIVAIGLPRSSRAPFPDNFDWLGGALYAPGVGIVLYAISAFGKPVSAAPVSIAIAIAVLLLGWWCRHELRHPQPLIDVRQLANRNILLANLAMLSAAAGVMQLTQVTSLLVQQPVETGAGLGKSATFLGAIKLPTVLVGVIGSLGAGWLIPRYGQKLPIMFGGLLIVFATLAVAFEQRDLFVILAVICTTSIGVNLVYAAIPTVVMASSPADRVSEATGLTAVFRATGQALGAQIIAVLMASSMVTLPDGRAYTAATGYLLAFLFMALTGLAVILATMGIGRLGKHEVKRDVAT